MAQEAISVIVRFASQLREHIVSSVANLVSYGIVALSVEAVDMHFCETTWRLVRQWIANIGVDEGFV